MPDICQCCLSIGRKISSAAAYTDVLFKILSQDSKDFPLLFNSWTSEPMLCWECIQVLRNVQKFQHMVYQAQAFLITHNSCVNFRNVKSLTTLGTVLKNQIDFNYDESCDTDKIFSADVKALVSCTEEDVKCSEIKYEDIDNDHYMDNIYPFEGDCKDEVNPTNEQYNLDINILKNIIPSTTTKKSCKRYQTSYEIVVLEDIDKCTKYSKVPIEKEYSVKLLERDLQQLSQKNYKYTCELCALHFKTLQKCKSHKKKHHNSSNKFICDICKWCHKTRAELDEHQQQHYFMFRCDLCSFEANTQRTMASHITRQHSKVFKCLDCGCLSKTRREFYKHCTEMHQHFVCDYCGKTTKKKSTLIKHIQNHHTVPRCDLCNYTFKKMRMYISHVNLKHKVSRSDATYCVECNLSFDNELKFKRHLRYSVIHNRPVRKCIPCPICKKTYRKTNTMRNHYKLVHEQKTNHYCDKCDKYFLNGFKLRSHVTTYHEKKVLFPKNKLCPYCGRGFSTRRILENHMRTHTGERPFACAYCSAKFAQKSALVTHARNIHKVKIKYSESHT